MHFSVFPLCLRVFAPVRSLPGGEPANRKGDCVTLFSFPAAVSLTPAVQLRNSQSGSIVPYSRRVCVNSAPCSLVPADFSHTKFAIQRQPPWFPPFTAATIFAIASTLIPSVIFDYHDPFLIFYSGLCTLNSVLGTLA
jgi:hypothetical protein